MKKPDSINQEENLDTNVTHPVRVMLDIETLGTTPGSVITHIGAAVVGHPNKVFEVYIDVDDAQREGLSIDWATVMWRMQNASPAELVNDFLDTERVGLRAALSRFADWYAMDAHGEELWGNGSVFDVGLLEAAYDAVRMPRTWGHRSVRCFRTMRSMHPQVAEPTRILRPHHALHDAIHQAEHLYRILDHAQTFQSIPH